MFYLLKGDSKPSGWLAIARAVAEPELVTIDRIKDRKGAAFSTIIYLGGCQNYGPF